MTGQTRKTGKRTISIKARSFILSLIFAALCNTFVECNDTKEFLLLREDISARNMSLGGMLCTFTPEDIDVMYNPASIRYASQKSLSITKIQQEYGAENRVSVKYVFPVKKYMLALDLNYFDASDIEMFTKDKARIGSTAYYEGYAGLSMGMFLDDKRTFSVGVSLKNAVQKIHNSVYSAVSTDMGANWNINKNFSLSCLYLAIPLTGENLPNEFRYGVSFSMKNFMAKYEYSLQEFSSINSFLALEYRMSRKFFLRAGYRNLTDRLKTNEYDALNNIGLNDYPGVTFGIGLLGASGKSSGWLNALQIDYAYSYNGYIGQKSYFTVGFKLN